MASTRDRGEHGRSSRAGPASKPGAAANPDEPDGRRSLKVFFRLLLEVMPGATPAESRLKRALKTLSWYGLRCRKAEEVRQE